MSSAATCYNVSCYNEMWKMGINDAEDPGIIVSVNDMGPAVPVSLLNQVQTSLLNYKHVYLQFVHKMILEHRHMLAQKNNGKYQAALVTHGDKRWQSQISMHSLTTSLSQCLYTVPEKSSRILSTIHAFTRWHQSFRASHVCCENFLCYIQMVS